MDLNAANTAIVLDSTADFPDGPTRFANWRVVPLYVTFGDTSYRDYVDLGPDEFYAKLTAASELPRTSQPTPGDFAAVYEELAGYDRIISLQLSSKLSGTYASAVQAAGGNARVRVIDTGTVSAAVAMLALAIQRRLEAGTTDEAIDALIEYFHGNHGLLLTMDTLEYLAKGGRIGKGAAFAGSLLNVKPVLAIQAGEVVPIKRVRGEAKAWEELRQLFEQSTVDRPSLRVGIAHSAAPARLEKLRQLVGESRPRAQIEVATILGAVVGTHAGPGTLGIFWFDDVDSPA